MFSITNIQVATPSPISAAISLAAAVANLAARDGLAVDADPVRIGSATVTAARASQTPTVDYDTDDERTSTRAGAMTGLATALATAPPLASGSAAAVAAAFIDYDMGSTDDDESSAARAGTRTGTDDTSGAESVSGGVVLAGVLAFAGAVVVAL